MERGPSPLLSLRMRAVKDLRIALMLAPGLAGPPQSLVCLFPGMLVGQMTNKSNCNAMCTAEGGEVGSDMFLGSN